MLVARVLNAAILDCLESNKTKRVKNLYAGPVEYMMTIYGVSQKTNSGLKSAKFEVSTNQCSLSLFRYTEDENILIIKETYDTWKGLSMSLKFNPIWTGEGG